MLNEADTRAKLVDPKLIAAGWGEDRIKREHFFYRQHEFARGRIYLIGEHPQRREPKRADYVLRYSDRLNLALIEAKDESHGSADALQDAKAKAEALDIPFAYSTNGHKFVEFDFITNTTAELDNFPSPEELWQRLTTLHEVLAEGGANPAMHPFCARDKCEKEPRYFQEVAINRVVREIMKGRKRQLLAMATGSGKTFIAFQIAWKLVKSGWLRRVLFLADRVILRDQAHNTFGAFEDARWLLEEGRFNKNRDIYISIYQAMWSGQEGSRLFQQIPSDFFDLIIIDECHRSGFGTWNEILKHFPDAIQLGMTATPKRKDNIDTYEYFCKETDDKPVYEYSLGRGIDDGFLAPYKVHRVRTNIDKDGLQVEDQKEQGAEFYIPPDAPDLKDVYHTPDFERDITAPDRTAQICDHLAGLMNQFGPMQKTIVFCASMQHAADVCVAMQARFAHLGHRDYAVRIVSEEPNAKELVEAFRDSDKRTPVVATTADLLETGVDIPPARNIVFLKVIGSPVVFKQIVGRGCRLDPPTDKKWFRVIDYTGASRLFDEWDHPPPEPGPRPEGPRDCTIEGLVVEREDYASIEGALVTALVAPNEQVWERTNADGFFRITGLPMGSIPVFAQATDYHRRQITVETDPSTPQHVVFELKRKGKKVAMIEARNLRVEIADEALFVIEKKAQQLTLQEYLDYSRGVVMSLSPTIDTLRAVWTDAESRQGFLAELAESSVHPQVLAEVKGLPEADQFDLLANLAFDAALHTRPERAERFLTTQQPFLTQHAEAAREVLLALLDKYRLGGVAEIARPDVFRVPPFDKMGQAPGVIKRFRDAEALRRAVQQMQLRLYAE